MGGAVSDLWGRASLEGLSVVGECSSTGAHGANRLASNSLLEAVVFAHRCAERLREDESAEHGAGAARAPPPLPGDARKALRALMQRHVGVERDATGLTAALADIDALIARAGRANELVAARLIAAAALAREESRGAHFRSDFPGQNAPKRTLMHDAERNDVPA
jgi:L-aspartate oxidase